MRKLITILLVLFSTGAFAQSYTYPNGDVLTSGTQSPARMKTQTWQSVHGYIYLPKSYDSSESKRYALLCYYHGVGGNGNPENAITDQGLGHMIANGTVPYSSTSPGDTTWFIVFTVAGDFMGSTQSLNDIGINYRFLLDYYKLKIDTNRVYATGLSAGGAQTLYALGAYPDIFVAGVPMSTMWSDILSKTTLDSTKGWIWQFHGSNDHGASTNIDNAISNINTYNEENPTHQALLSTYEGGHCCWETFYNPSWSWDTHRSDEIGGPTDMSMYTWLLQYERETTPTGENQPPSVNAGEDQSVNFPSGSAQLEGTASDPDGTISSVKWTVMESQEGSSVSFSDSTSLSTNVSGMSVPGQYKFKLTVTDNDGASSFDEVTVTVFKQTNQPPDVYAGEDQIHGSQYTSATLSGTATDPDGSIITTHWSQIDGDEVSIANPDQLTTIISGLSAGQSYTFRLVATDNEGAESYDDIVVTMRSTNASPVANAGSDQTLSSGTTTATLNGSGADDDGTISSYHWTTSSSATINSPNTATTTVSGLQDGNSYTFTLTVTDNGGATGSDDVTITISDEEEPPADDTAIYKIPLDPNKKFWNGDTVFYQLNDPVAGGLAKNLIDEQEADPLHGVNTKPSTLFWSGFKTHNEYPTEAVIDLGGVYKITNLFFYENLGTAYLRVKWGTPFHWSDSAIFYSGGNGWKDYKDSIGVIYTRYLSVSYDIAKKGYEKTLGMILYGHRSGDTLTTIEPDRNIHKPTVTMDQFMGVNTYGQVPFPVQRGVAGIYRTYANQDYLDTARAGIPVDSVKFVFSKFSGNRNNFRYIFTDPDTVLRWTSLGGLVAGMGDNVNHYDSLGIDYFWAIQGRPQFANDSGWGKSIDLILHPDRDSSNPFVYDRLSRMAWQLGAMFGKNTYPKDSMQVLFPEHDTSGMDILHYVEAGNENNGGWLDHNEYYTPSALSAYHSAFYDGDAGAMGNRFGIKQADPNIKVVMAGDASTERIAYLKSMKYFSYYRRSDHRIPFDVYNIHAYPYAGNTNYTWGGNAVTPETYKGQGTRHYLDSMAEVAHEVCARCEVWLTEWGYDRNRWSPLAVPIIQGETDSAKIQADWISRFWFISSFSNIDRAILFQIRNDPSSKSLDSNSTVKFMSSGLLNGYASYPDGSQAGAVFDYTPFPAYYYTHTIWGVLHGYKADSIIYENHDSLWVYRYRNVEHPDSVAYAVWSGTRSSRIVDSLSIKTGHSNAQALIVGLADKKMYGDSSFSTSDSNGDIPLVIDETPKILLTTEGEDGGTLVENGVTPPANESPVANAGEDQTLTSDKTSTTLSGNGTDSDGTIESYQWTTTSDATITSPNNKNTTVTGLEKGQSYTFTLTVTDNDGATDEDQVTITVNPNRSPIADAGTDKTLGAGTTSTSLEGAGSDPDGTITYKWTQVSGEDVTINNSTSATCNVSGLQNGNTYVFKLTVTDDDGDTDSDNVTVTVEEAPPAQEGTLEFKWVRKIDDTYYLIFQNSSTGKYYSIKLVN